MESSDQPARVLVVANRTAATPALIAAVRERAERGPARFTLLVPNTSSGLERFADPEDHADTEAQSTLELALPLLEEAAGSRGHRHGRRPEPLDAIQDAVNLHGFDEIILSTLPTAGVALAQARPSVQVRRPRPADHHRHRQRARGAGRGLSLGGGVSPFLYWMQVLIVLSCSRARSSRSSSSEAEPAQEAGLLRQRRSLRERRAVEDRARHLLGHPRRARRRPAARARARRSRR